MTPEQRSRLTQLSRLWVDDPLVQGGFRRVQPGLWIHEQPISALVRLRTRRTDDARVRFTFEWGFFSPRFAEAMHYPPAPSTLTCALRAPIGRLLGDGRFDVWWAIASNGAVAREIAFEVRPVDPDHDTELRQAITERLVPLARSVTTVAAIVSRWQGLTGILNTGLADPDRTLELIRTPTVGASGSPWELGDVDALALPVVHVERDETSDDLLITFDDEVAHLHEDLVLGCLTYCSSFPNVQRADWQDREIIRLRGEAIDVTRLQDGLLEIIERALAARIGDETALDDDAT